MPQIDPKYLIAYACSDTPENDTDVNGGGVDATIRVNFALTIPQSSIDIDSGAGNAGTTITVVLRKKSGAKLVITQALSGTLHIPVTANSIASVLKVTMDHVAVGTVTVNADLVDLICTIPPGERGVRSMFIDSFFDLVPKTYYEKFFWKNTAPALQDVLDGVLQRSKDQSMFREIGLVDFAVESVVNGEETTVDRLTPPLNTSSFDDSDKALPGNVLISSQSIGVWLRLNLRRKYGFEPFQFLYGTRIVSQSPQ